MKLMESQTLFKCLKYTTSDALSQADLTEDEIFELTNQEGDMKDTRVLFTPFNLNVDDTARTELRVFVRRFKPNNIYLANVEVSIQVITHNSLCRLDNGQQRLLVMIQEILKLLHGTDIGFIGNLLFENDISIGQYNSFFTGYELIPTTRSA